MDISNFKELGIALSSIIIFAYFVKYIIDSNKEVFKSMSEANKEMFNSLITQLNENRTDYTSFVETNNHGNSDRIEKSTEAMVKVGAAIEGHTAILERLLIKLDK